MTIKTKFLFVTLLFFSSLSAETRHSLLQVDDEAVLKKIVLSSKDGKTSLLAATGKKQSKKLKYTVYYLELQNGKITASKPLEMKPVSDETEERILTMFRIGGNKVVMLSMSDNKNDNIIVLRIFSTAGELQHEKLLTTGSKWGGILERHSSDKLFYLSYINREEKKRVFCEIDDNLNTVREGSLKHLDQDLEPKAMNTFIYRNGFIYAIYLNQARSQADLPKIAQVEILKLELESGKVTVTQKMILERHLMNHRFFATEKCLELICVSSKDYNGFGGVITSVQMNWDNLEHHLYTAKFDSASARLFLAAEVAKAVGKDSKMLLHVRRNATDHSYTFCLRTAEERCVQFAYAQSASPSMSCEATFHDCVVFTYDSAFSKISNVLVVKNTFKTAGSSSRLFLLNEPNGDFYQMPYSSDPGKELLAYSTNVNMSNHILNLQVLQNGKYSPETPLQIDLALKDNTFFYIRTFEEMSPGEFIGVVYIRGKGDQLFVVKVE